MGKKKGKKGKKAGAKPKAEDDATTTSPEPEDVAGPSDAEDGEEPEDGAGPEPEDAEDTAAEAGAETTEASAETAEAADATAEAGAGAGAVATDETAEGEGDADDAAGAATDDTATAVAEDAALKEKEEQERVAAAAEEAAAKAEEEQAAAAAAKAEAEAAEAKAQAEKDEQERLVKAEAEAEAAEAKAQAGKAEEAARQDAQKKTALDEPPSTIADAPADASTDVQSFIEARKKAREKQQKLRSEKTEEVDPAAPATFASISLSESSEPAPAASVATLETVAAPVEDGPSPNYMVSIGPIDDSGPGFEYKMSKQKTSEGSGTLCVITQVDKKGPAEKLSVGDRVVAIAGIRLATCPPGECKVLLKNRTLEMVLEQASAAAPAAKAANPKSAKGVNKGCRVVTLERGTEMKSLGFDISIVEERDIFGSGSFVRVKTMAEGGTAATSGDAAGRLKVGDQIVQVNAIKLATCHPRNVLSLFKSETVQLQVRSPLAAGDGKAETGGCAIC